MKSVATLAILVGFSLVCMPSLAFGDTRVGRARLDVKSLEQAVTAYWVKFREWPTSLEMLTRRLPDGSPAMLNNDRAIIDPWNQSYHYDPKQLSPDTGKPLIWSDGAPGDSRGKIANWGEGSTFQSPSNIPWLAIAVLTGLVVLLVCWILLPESKKALKWLLLAGWLLAAAAAFCYVIYDTKLD